MAEYPFEELDTRNMSEGMHVLFQYVSSIEPIFFPLVLFAIFIIVCLGSFFTQKNLTGKGNFLASASVAGFITTIAAYVLSLVPGIVNTFTVIVCLVVSIVFTLLFLLKKD